jgi:hypothetical protein
MGEAKRKKLTGIGPTELRPKVDIDCAIEEFEALIESGRIEGFVQVVKLQPPGVKERLPISELKLMTFGLEKRDVYDMLCIMKRSMEETMGFREDEDKQSSLTEEGR